MGSMLGVVSVPDVWCSALMIKMLSLMLLCQMRIINSASRGECLGPKQAKLINMYSKDFHQRSCNQRRVGSLLCSMINDLWEGYLDKRKVRILDPFSGQDGYQALVPQHSIDSYISKHTIHFHVNNTWFSTFVDAVILFLINRQIMSGMHRCLYI